MLLPPLPCTTGFVLETLKQTFPPPTFAWPVCTDVPFPTTVTQCGWPPAGACSPADAAGPASASSPPTADRREDSGGPESSLHVPSFMFSGDLRNFSCRSPEFWGY